MHGVPLLSQDSCTLCRFHRVSHADVPNLRLEDILQQKLDDASQDKKDLLRICAAEPRQRQQLNLRPLSKHYQTDHEQSNRSSRLPHRDRCFPHLNRQSRERRVRDCRTEGLRACGNRLGPPRLCSASTFMYPSFSSSPLC